MRAPMKETLQDWLLIGWLAMLEVGRWLDDASAVFPPLSWFLHAVVAVPLAFLHPWCPAVVFGVREAEQALHAHLLRDEPVTWARVGDRILDVVAPAVVGWWLG